MKRIIRGCDWCPGYTADIGDEGLSGCSFALRDWRAERHYQDASYKEIRAASEEAVTGQRCYFSAPGDKPGSLQLGTTVTPDWCPLRKGPITTELVKE